MKKLTMVLAAASLAASGAAFADPPAMHGTGAHAGVHASVNANPNAGAVLHSPVPNAHASTRLTTRVVPDSHRAKAHTGWTKGKHKGWRERCGYRFKDGRRYHTCWRVAR
ncbi:hypothetical protein OKA06_05235 [Novosphingobium sp. MW5]|nr:hypothetical protein [Novosphingobium sp. MW5]